MLTAAEEAQVAADKELLASKAPSWQKRMYRAINEALETEKPDYVAYLMTELARTCLYQIPGGARELSLALTNVQQAGMWLNAYAVANKQDAAPDAKPDTPPVPTDPDTEAI